MSTAEHVQTPAAAPPQGGNPSRILRRKLRRDLLRQKWQFIAVGITILLGVALFAASYDAYQNLSISYARTYERLALADFTVVGGDQAAFASAAQGTAGVSAVTQRLRADLPIQVGPDHKLVGRMISLPTDGQPAVGKVDVLEGNYLDPADANGVLVETHMANHFDLHPGDTIQVFVGLSFTTVHIVGVVASAEYLWPARNRQDVLTTPDDFGVVFAAEALVTRALGPFVSHETLVEYDQGADRTALDATMQADAVTAGAANTITRADQPSNAALNEDVQGFNELSFLFPLLFLTAAGMATFVLLTRLVWSQRAIIGTLMAEGLRKGTVLRHFVAYGIVVGLAGAVAGIVIGLPLGGLITGAYTSALSIPDTVVGFHPLTPLYGLVFGLVMGVIAALVPARAAAKVVPAEGMRGNVPVSGQRGSLIERILPPLRRLPIRWKVPLRGIGRSPRRSISTVIGVILSLTLILASWGIIDTTDLLVNRQFVTIQHNDAQVVFSVPLTDNVLAQLRGVDGVARVEEVATLPATIRAGTGQYATQLQAFQPDTTMHTFLSPSNAELSLPDNGILAGVALKDLIDIAPGDPITIVLPGLSATISTTLAGFVDEPLGTLAYISRDLLDQLLAAASPPVDTTTLASPTVASSMVTYQPSADAETVRAGITHLGAVAAVVTSNAIAHLVDQYLGLLYAFVGIMLLFGSIMAFVLIFNTISVNLAERSVEFATMRASGLAARTVSAMMSRENLLLTIVAIPLGLILGYEVAVEMMSSFSSDLFSFDLEMRVSTLVISAVAVLVVTALSQWPATRVVRRLDIARVVRERSQ